jgi:hypothetical protein
MSENKVEAPQVKATGSVSMGGNGNAERWDWCVRYGMFPEKSPEGGWILYARRGLFLGETPEQAVDAARAAE